MGAQPSREYEPVCIEVGRGADVPLLGDVAAGLPFESLPVHGVIELPPGLWNGRRVFALLGSTPDASASKRGRSAPSTSPVVWTSSSSLPSG